LSTFIISHGVTLDFSASANHHHTMLSNPLNKQTIGRFAPSPTGFLHFGSLVTAVASYCLAKQAGGLWLVRMEDLDQAREIPGAADTILRQLESFGLHWDGKVIYQSQRGERYGEITAELQRCALIYPCSCSRKQLELKAQHLGNDGPIYPGTCLIKPPHNLNNTALRLKTTQQVISFSDQIHGVIAQNIAQEVGDFILRRRDGIFAYQLAVVVDDYDSGVNQIVRGRDLLASTARQIYLAQQLGFTVPEYSHIPLALSSGGVKISKSHHQINLLAQQNVAELLYKALIFLGQQPPPFLKNEQAAPILAWATENFCANSIPIHDLPAPDLGL
jgi:glutamyl-Q tRNA(Asp) synthetase